MAEPAQCCQHTCSENGTKVDGSVFKYTYVLFKLFTVYFQYNAYLFLLPVLLLSTLLRKTDSRKSITVDVIYSFIMG